MYYFKINNNIIEKYEVIFDKEKLEQLKLEIINKCSLINHIEYEGYLEPYRYNQLQIRNIQKRNIGIREYETEPDMDLYLYSYDEYKFPNLVYSINKLISGYSQAIEEIFNNAPQKNFSYTEELNELVKDLNDIDLLSIDEKRKKLDKIEEFLKYIELNSKQKNVEEYYPIVQNQITFNFIDSLPLETINRVNEFYEYNVIHPIKTKRIRSLK